MPLSNPIFPIISQAARESGVRAFVIGGYVRDFFLERPCKDIDIVVEGSGIDLAEKVAALLHTPVHVYKQFGTAMLCYQDIEIEFVGARKESYRADSRKPVVEDGSIEDDQMRRDFTVNALAFSLQDSDYGCLIDPFGGVKDMQNGLLRTPLDPDVTYSDDPLRMLRAIRFASQLGFSIVPESFASIQRNVRRLEIVSMERIADELHKIIMSSRPSQGFRLLDQSGLLSMILPQLEALKGVETMEGRGHKENFSHTLQVVENIAKISDDLWLRWAALLHDVGKPATKQYDSKTGWSFHGHDFVGSKMIPGIFKRLRLPLNEKMKFVQKMVLLHLRPISLVQEQVTDSAIRRLLFEAGDDIDVLMLLCEADITSKNEQTAKLHLDNFAKVRQKLIEVEEKDAIRNFQPPISGDMIMQKYNLNPCQEVGLIKERIKNAILDGQIRNEYQEAYALMERIAKEMGIGDVR
ncbi:MAG: CCA tRNA nucleotidyltransferase [Prevotellaceae bacterium]|jgi:poly(A) polymerase|nr:CCA tRNA nucleotidyltransferase [Prevotellaceae bacterium]